MVDPGTKGRQVEGMKIYVHEMGWAGCIVVTAYSKEEAIEKIQKEGPYDKPCTDPEEFELENFSYYCMGDQ
jgi:hypothetical protein